MRSYAEKVLCQTEHLACTFGEKRTEDGKSAKLLSLFTWRIDNGRTITDIFGYIMHADASKRQKPLVSDYFFPFSFLIGDGSGADRGAFEFGSTPPCLTLT